MEAPVICWVMQRLHNGDMSSLSMCFPMIIDEISTKFELKDLCGLGINYPMCIL